MKNAEDGADAAKSAGDEPAQQIPGRTIDAEVKKDKAV